jgi:hypothetical protein
VANRNQSADADGISIDTLFKVQELAILGYPHGDGIAVQ